MRRRSLACLSLLVGAGALLVTTPEPAIAACPPGDGTLPGSPSSVYRVGTGDATPYTTIYVDDRDFADVDDEGDAEGIWLYLESNGVGGLQRGGPSPGARAYELQWQVAREVLKPTPVLPPNPGGLPVFPNGFTLFPDGFGGGGPPPPVWVYEDYCRADESGATWDGEPDQLLL